MKKLMIIGASILQLPAIKKAKEMGLHVAVVDYNRNAVGIEYADKYYNASTMDEDAVAEAAEDYKPDGIMTLATDMPMRGVSKSSARLGLKSIPYETAIKATDKHEMIRSFEKHDVPHPWFFAVRDEQELHKLLPNINYPCIMKPTDNAGSHGVVLVGNEGQLKESYGYSRSNSRGGEVIIEEYLQGQEVSVEVMVTDGNVNILQITDKLTTGAPHFVEMGHSQPSRLTEHVQMQIKQVAENAVKAVGIDCGPAHVEMMITQRGPVMIELGARMGGDNITTHLVPLSTGIDMVKATIDVALGNQPDITVKRHCGSAIRFIKAPSGKIAAITGVDEAGLVPGIKEISFTKHVGDQSTDISSSNDRIGCVIAQAPTAEEAIAACEKAMQLIHIEIA